MEETTETVITIPLARVQNLTVEQIMDVMPQFQEELSKCSS